MELATNQFTKGLLMDTNPMVLGNDTLTDCLNGTLITMNGNEVILQNDMGNRRVDNAFLPPGYEPVGIKEYGGIIYVAAYNPITNKSLIGSFPSPERRINSYDDLNLQGTFDFDLFFNSSNITKDSDLEIDCINTDSFIIPLTKDTSLRAGDKFVVYCDEGLYSLRENITNYYNTCYSTRLIGNTTYSNLIALCDDVQTLEDYLSNIDFTNIDRPISVEGQVSPGGRTTPSGPRISISKKVFSPKNRKYTLSLGILNSLNEFVDITKTLARWKKNNDSWEIVKYDYNPSELYMFNDGYFIPDSFSNPGLGETISDSELIRLRQVIEANTYSYKLIGPLYLKVHLNHITGFNYNIYGLYNYEYEYPTIEGGGGTRSGEIAVFGERDFIADSYKKTVTLWVEGYITYNCPDLTNLLFPSNIASTINNKNSDENYATYDECKGNDPNFTFDFFDFCTYHDSRPSSYEAESPGEITKSDSIYNPNTNLYTVKVTKKYTFDYDENNPNLNYVIGVLANKDLSAKYLRELSSKGLINLSLLGSGIVTVTGWRFYNNLEKGSTTLTVAFEAYPELNKKFKNLNFNFKDITRLEEVGYEGINYGGLSIYNGRQTYEIDWGDKLEPRKVYKVTITYDIVEQDGTISNEGVKVTDYTISTNLSEQYIFNEIDRWILTTELFNEFYSSTSGISDFCNLTGVDQEIVNSFVAKMNVNLRGKGNIVNKSKHSESLDGGLTSKSTNISYICNHEYDINITSNPELTIINEELYPDFVKIKTELVNSINIHDVIVKSIGNEEIIVGQNQTASTVINDTFKNLLNTVKGNLLTNNSKTPFASASENLLRTSISPNAGEKTISGTIQYKDIYKGYNNSVVPELYNVFDSLSNIINEALPQGSYFAGTSVTYENKDYGEGDHHFLQVAKFETETMATNISTNGETKPGYEDILELHGDKRKDFYFSKNSSKIYQAFNSSLYLPGQMFLYMFHKYSSRQDFDLYFPTNITDTHGKKGDLYTRLWWRTTEGEWATFNDLLNTKNSGVENENNVKNFILSKLKHDYVYCMYNTYFNDGTTSIYAPDEDYIYYDKYNIPLIISINWAIPANTTVLDGVEVTGGSYPSCGNLSFKLYDTEIESEEILFDLISSEQFNEYINTFDKDNISNIDLSTGLLIDSSGLKLNPSCVYYKNIEVSSNWSSIPDEYQMYNVIRFEREPLNGDILHIIVKLYHKKYDLESGVVYYYTYDEEYRIEELYDVNNTYNISDEHLLAVITDSANNNANPMTPEYSRLISKVPATITDNAASITKIYRTNNYFIVDTHNTINGKNTLVYNRHSMTSPEDGRFQSIEGNHEPKRHTVLIYDSVNVISKDV